MPDRILNPSNGLSKTKLENTTAAVSDVLSGKTFYSGDDTLKSGTMTNRGTWNSTINPGGSVTIPAGYHNGSGRVTANSAPSGVIDVLGVVNDAYVTNNYFSKTIYSGYKSFVWVQYCDYSNGHLYPAPPAISSGSLSQVFSIVGLGWIWVINNASMPFTISSRANEGGFYHQYILFLGVR